MYVLQLIVYVYILLLILVNIKQYYFCVHKLRRRVIIFIYTLTSDNETYTISKCLFNQRMIHADTVVSF